MSHHPRRYTKSTDTAETEKVPSHHTHRPRDPYEGADSIESITDFLGLVDIGANLSHRSFKHNVPEVLKDAKRYGVGTIVITGTNLPSSNSARTLCDNNRNSPVKLYFTAGYHPHDASKWNNESASKLRGLYKHKQCLAVGECGLDYDRMFSPKEVQKTVFKKHLDLAVETGLPLFLHEREAFDDFVEIFKEYSGRVSGIVHCFSGERHQAQAYLDLGLDIGITGMICDNRPHRSASIKESTRIIPLDRLHVETDAPFLFPHSIKPREKSNTPKNLHAVVSSIAEVKSVDPQDIATASQMNFLKVFKPTV